MYFYVFNELYEFVSNYNYIFIVGALMINIKERKGWVID